MERWGGGVMGGEVVRGRWGGGGEDGSVGGEVGVLACCGSGLEGQ